MRFLLSYIDPGNGSFIIQAAVGAVLGVSYFARTHIRTFFGRFRRGTDTKTKVEAKSNE